MDIFLQIIIIMFLDIVLSIDNAILIASVTKDLEERNRKIAQWLGAFSAVGMRLIFIVVIMITLNLLVGIPLIYLTGGILLIYLGVRLTYENKNDNNNLKASSSILKAIGIIIAGDLILSFDNAFIIADIVSSFDWISHGINQYWAQTLLNILIVSIALLISILIIILFADGLTEFMKKYEWIIYIATWLLISIGIEMIMSDFIWNVLFNGEEIQFDINQENVTPFFEEKIGRLGVFFISYFIGGIISLIIFLFKKNK